jgi:hypothetical protein
MNMNIYTGFEETIGTNHIGHFYLTQLLAENLEKTSTKDQNSRYISIHVYIYIHICNLHIYIDVFICFCAHMIVYVYMCIYIYECIYLCLSTFV